MAELKLIFFEGCPNINRIREILKDTGYDFEEVNRDDLPDGHPFRNYSSPAILNNGRMIFGAFNDSGLKTCSLKIPTAHEIKEKIEKL
ncbi:MAG: hypothetical protein ACHQYP_01525 [Nitrospiria bacterium]